MLDEEKLDSWQKVRGARLFRGGLSGARKLPKIESDVEVMMEGGALKFLVRIPAAGGGTTCIILALDRHVLEDLLWALPDSDVINPRLARIISVLYDKTKRLYQHETSASPTLRLVSRTEVDE